MLAWLWLFLRSSCRNGVLSLNSKSKSYKTIMKIVLDNGCELRGHNSLAL